MFHLKIGPLFTQFTTRRGPCGKLGEGSDKSGPRIGNPAESSDKRETMELIALPKRTLLRQQMKIRLVPFLLKSTLLFSNKSDCGNRVRTFAHEKFG